MDLPNVFETLPPERVAEALELAIKDLQQTHAAAVGQLVSMAERATGEQLGQSPTKSVLDHTVDDLSVILRRAEHLRAAVDGLKTWTLPSERPTAKIGHRLKTLPPDVAGEITNELRAAGLLS
jgi:hypothetical protein